jgi:hypothetical protein
MFDSPICSMTPLIRDIMLRLLLELYLPPGIVAPMPMQVGASHRRVEILILPSLLLRERENLT